jgi:hypothetical protein
MVRICVGTSELITIVAQQVAIRGKVLQPIRYLPLGITFYTSWLFTARYLSLGIISLSCLILVFWNENFLKILLFFLFRSILTRRPELLTIDLSDSDHSKNHHPRLSLQSLCCHGPWPQLKLHFQIFCAAKQLPRTWNYKIVNWIPCTFQFHQLLFLINFRKLK